MARILTLPSTGALTMTGALTLSGTSGNILVCDTSVLVVDATNNRVGINTASPSYGLDTTQTGTMQTGVLHFGNAIAITNTADTHPVVYGTASSGAAYPYLEAGNLVIQARPAGVARDVVLLTGISGASMFVFDRNGRIGLGGTTAATYTIGMSGNAAKSIGMERHTTANTAGTNLTIQSGGATSGATDKAPGDLILATGLGTSAGAPGRVRLRRGGYISPTSGTTDQTLIDCQIIDAHKALSDNVSADLLSCTVAAGTGIGVVIEYTIFVTDLTDHQVEAGFVVVSAVNKAGTVTRTINEVNSQQSVSAGTLNTTWAVSAAAPAVVSLTADTSLTVGSGYMYVTFSAYNHGHQAIALA